MPPEGFRRRGGWQASARPPAGRERIMDHRRAATRRMEADLLFCFEHDDSGMIGQGGCGGQAGDAASDDQNIGAWHVAQPAVSRSFTTLPSLVSRIALTI